MKNYPNPGWDADEQPDTDTLTLDAPSLVLYNDEVNSFDHVIWSLIEVCDHAPEQAEQCALLVHHKGSCKIKEGESFSALKPYRDALAERGLDARIE